MVSMLRVKDYSFLNLLEYHYCEGSAFLPEAISQTVGDCFAAKGAARNDMAIQV
jgi:hypothetical protein